MKTPTLSLDSISHFASTNSFTISVLLWIMAQWIGARSIWKVPIKDSCFRLNLQTYMRFSVEIHI